MAYRIELKPGAARDLQSLPADVQGRIRVRIDSLADNPRPRGCDALKGEENLFRVRVGDYRILYQIHRRVLRVLVIRIGHRREVYRRKGTS